MDEEVYVGCDHRLKPISPELHIVDECRKRGKYANLGIDAICLSVLDCSPYSIRSRGSPVSPFLKSQSFMLISSSARIGFSSLADWKKWG